MQDPLPAPSADALAHSERVTAHIRDEIAAAGGRIGFDRYMDLALYAPGLGYYSAGSRKLGADGDFITAPELSPLFGQTLARQAQQVLETGLDSILEVGAGSGALAATLLAELERLDALPETYLILELSADLRERSRDTLAARVPHLLERVAWLNRLPPAFSGFVVGNEVLDAMPVKRVGARPEGVFEQQVAWDARAGRFHWVEAPADSALRAEVASLGLPQDGYATEIAFAARAFMHSLAGVLKRGVALFFDYGFPRAEYYHPQRRDGTLMCHYRHRAHADPFYLPGLQDITSHVDFTAMAEAGHAPGLELAGYTTQAQFLINCGITDIMARTSPEQVADYLPLANQANRLMSPAEMGELFKVIGFSRGAGPLVAFSSGDRSARL
jgi:SAM-dependent MidA family methyltransferase